MSKWGKTQGDSGILRKAEGPAEKIDDLLVFGYACKLFRDDEKALEIDQGKHLIPWMGDDTLKIDSILYAFRCWFLPDGWYDGRAALSDVSQYEGSTEGYDTARWLGLTDAERRVEQLCDEERYRALNTNEDEEELYREEELKRLHQQLSNEKNYGQVSYDYDSNKTQKDGNDTDKGETEETGADADDDEPFVPPPDFDCPVNMILPSTVKQNARIEKTALFISQQGAQMEILLKAKQAGNPQFEFLSHDSQLHRYYRHILMAIKTGRYKHPVVHQPPADTAVENEDNEHYLHPSLAPITSRVESAPSIPNIAYKPSADCAYTMLISKIKGAKPTTTISINTNTSTTLTNSNSSTDNNIQSQQQQLPIPTPTTSTNFNFPPNSTYIYNYATGKYEPAPPPPPTHIVENNQFTEGTNMYVPPNPVQFNTSYTSTTENTKGATIYGVKEIPQINTTTIPQLQTKPAILLTKEMPKPILPIAQYSGSSESESDNENDTNLTKAIINVPAYEIPPPDVQLIIDKMASYVARNGSDFEAIVRSKGDPRFSFLIESHTYHAYYKHKLKLYGGVVVDEKCATNIQDSQQKTDENVKNCNEKHINNDKAKKNITPVSFSIKKSKEPESMPIERSALPVEESSEESEEDQDNNKDENNTDELEKQQKQNNLENSFITQQSLPETDITANKNSPIVSYDETNIQTLVQEEKSTEQTEINQTSVIEIEDNIQEELIDLTDDLEERRGAKRAEEKIKDKIAAAAREKMSLLSRNRELQIERKRRAAAFLSKIKSSETQLNNEPIAAVNNTTEQQIDYPKNAEEDDLLKRICEFDSEDINTKLSENKNRDNVTSVQSPLRTNDHRTSHHKSSRKKRKKRGSSSESSRKHHKRSKHEHEHRHERSSKKKKCSHSSRSRSRSRSSSRRRHHHTSTSRHSHSRSRSLSHRSSRSKYDDNTIVKDHRHKTKTVNNKRNKNEERSSGEISSTEASSS